MPEAYNPKVIEHLVRPRNVGELEAPSGVGESGDATCGDVARFSVRIRDSFLENVRYKAYGCAACLAAGSALSELTRGRPLLDAARVSKADLEGLWAARCRRARATSSRSSSTPCTRLSKTTGTDTPGRCSSRDTRRLS